MATTFKPDEAPPVVAVSWFERLRRGFFGSPFDAALTVLGLAVLYLVLTPLLEWAIFKAAWLGNGPEACPDKEAACWVFIRARGAQLVYGPYPPAERWRVDLVLALGIIGLVLMLVPRVPAKIWIGAVMLSAYPALVALLLAGGAFGLAPVDTADWGGLMLTLVVATWGIATSMPLGLVLALGRRSQMPVVRALSVAFIEFWRGVPLIAVLFMAATMFPLFMPAGATADKLLRALIAFSLFNAAYMAEVFRGGLQAVPVGQYEAARSLGLGYWRLMGLIVLPQAFRIAIPGLVNTCIGIFKETTLILVIGLFDLLAVIQAGIADPAWLIGDHVRETGYFFAGLGFWFFCFGMSRYSARLERRLSAGRATT
ncbi:MAG: amino acid ABC transporter permease [Alphaproteobacteria bacterium]|nr:amino acid ABC transporter permease [Alphaproteobacteria bacterium]